MSPSFLNLLCNTNLSRGRGSETKAKEHKGKEQKGEKEFLEFWALLEVIVR